MGKESDNNEKKNANEEKIMNSLDFTFCWFSENNYFFSTLFLVLSLFISPFTFLAVVSVTEPTLTRTQLWRRKEVMLGLSTSYSDDTWPSSFISDILLSFIYYHHLCYFYLFTSFSSIFFYIIIIHLFSFVSPTCSSVGSIST